MYDVKDKQAVSQTRQIRQKDSIKHKDVTNFPNNDDPGFKTVVSACLWMSGNMFIGPNAEKRIDDKGETFDFGGYRDAPASDRSMPWTDVEQGNLDMGRLKDIYDQIKAIKKDWDGPELSEAGKADLDERIVGVLTSLSSISQKKETLHKMSQERMQEVPGIRQAQIEESELAYNIKDWVYVGNLAALGHGTVSKWQIESGSFASMYQSYKAFKGKDDGMAKGYCQLFETHINLDKCKNLEKSTGYYVMAKYTYNILHKKWVECISS